VTGRPASRRRFLAGLGAGFAARGAAAQAPADAAGSLTDVGGLRVGHFTDPRRPTGCTVVLFDKPAAAGADYNGSAPAETLGVMLQPVSPLEHIHAILLLGGGPLALGASAGVVRFLEEQKVGYDWGIPNLRIPVVVGAAIDDLALGDGRIRVGPDEAYRACQQASAAAVAEGSVGAGAGATVGKLFAGRGHQGMKGGVGCASARLGRLAIGVLVVVNAAGDVVDRKGAIVAGARDADGRGFASTLELLRRDLAARSASALGEEPLRATTLTLVATNLALSKTQLTKLAMMAGTGAARAIQPYHTQSDGDQVLAVSTGQLDARASLTAVGAAAAELVSDAVVRAVTSATGVPGWLAVRDLPKPG
jgi:L-aminopeptidase/D-esterase-like protein